MSSWYAIRPARDSALCLSKSGDALPRTRNRAGDGRRSAGAMAWVTPGDHFAARDVERGEEGGRAMASIVVGATLRLTGAQLQQGRCVIERLHLRLLIDAEHQSAFGRRADTLVIWLVLPSGGIHATRTAIRSDSLTGAWSRRSARSLTSGASPPPPTGRAAGGGHARHSPNWRPPGPLQRRASRRDGSSGAGPRPLLPGSPCRQLRLLPTATVSRVLISPFQTAPHVTAHRSSRSRRSCVPCCG